VRQGLTWGELILTLLAILLLAGVGFIPWLTGSVFYNQFWFCWLFFAAFVGMTPLLALRTPRLGALWHIGTAVYVLLCKGLCFHDQHFFARGGVGNLIWSAPAIVGLLSFSEWWFELPTTKAGKMTITKDDLPGLPSGALVEPAEIEVVEVVIPEERIPKFCDIGAAVNKQNGNCVITELFGGSSASAAGLKEGDIITHIDTKDVSALDVHQIRALLRGQQNTIVVLTIQRPGETTPKNFTVARRLVNAERK